MVLFKNWRGAWSIIFKNYRLRNSSNLIISRGNDDYVDVKLVKSDSGNLLSTHAPSPGSRPEQVVNAASKNKEPFDLAEADDACIKQILVIDDDDDSAFAIKACLESYHSESHSGKGFQVMEVTTYTNPVTALLEFKPYYYDLLLVDINMPSINGYELVAKITKLDLNIKVCFMSSGEVNYEALQEIHHPARSFGCFIRKPATNDYLVNRVVQELFQLV